MGYRPAVRGEPQREWVPVEYWQCNNPAHNHRTENAAADKRFPALHRYAEICLYCDGYTYAAIGRQRGCSG